MRTKASIKGHPIHPTLVVYPIAFLHGSFAADLAGRITGRRAFYRYGKRLGEAGLAMGILAGVPGLIDYLYTVPPRSSGKKRATTHLLVNSGALALFGLSQWLRRRRRGVPGAAVLGTEAAGVGLLMVGAWLGSTLIHRNFVGPIHRQAGAGRLREERLPEWNGEPLPVAKVDELEVDQMKLLQIDGRRIVLGRTEEGYVAFDDRCTHRGASLADGVMICGTVQCLWHGSQFDATTGEVRAGPARDPIETYRVEVAEDEVHLLLESTVRPGDQERVGEQPGIEVGETIEQTAEPTTRWTDIRGRRMGRR